MLSLFSKQPQPSTSNYEFKRAHVFERRKQESERIIKKYTKDSSITKVPVIVEKSDSSDVSDIKKSKWIVSTDLTFGQYVYLLRKNIDLKPSEGLICFVANSYLPATAALIGDIYKEHHDKDGFMYITYSKKEMYG